MLLQKFIDLERKITNDKIEEVLGFAMRSSNFKEDKNDITLLNGRIKKLNKDIINGVVSYDNSILERNKIRLSVLEVVKNTKRKYVSIDEENYYYSQEKLALIINETENLYESICERGNEGYAWINNFDDKLNEIKNKWENQQFSVSIIALMKSGKSTLLNAWMGNEYLSANLKPETMRVVRIIHESKAIEGKLMNKGRCISKGAEKTRLKLSALNKKARDKDNIPSDEELSLKVNLPAFRDKDFKGVKFELLDTPGVNEAGVHSLETKVNRLVGASDVIIYLLDLSKLKSDDEEKMFKKLRDERDELFKEIKTKLFFVVNKIDMIENRNFGEAKGFNSLEDVKKYIIGYLKTNTSIIIKPDELFLVSAEKTVLGRVLLSGEATEKQRNDFLKMAYGTKRRRELPEEYIMADALEFIEESGIQFLEEKILNKIHSKRIKIFLSSITFKLEKLLDQIQRNIEVSHGSLEKKVIQIDILKKDIERIQLKLSELTRITSDFKKKGDESITYYFKEFQKKIIESIEFTFSGDERAKRDNLLPKIVTEYLKTTNYTIKSGNEIEINKAVNNLHFQVIKSLDSNFKLVWSKTLRVIHEYHKEQSVLIDKVISPLVREIEEKINRELNINLKPNVIQVPPLSLNEFYSKIGNEVFTLINKKRTISPRFETNIRRATRDTKFLFWTIRKKGEFYKVTQFKFFKDQYSFSSLKYRGYLVQQVEKLTSNTEEVAKKIVQSQFEKMKVEIEEEIKSYSKQYIYIIESEIQKKEEGVDIKKRKEFIENDLLKTINLLDRVKIIKSG